MDVLSGDITHRFLKSSYSGLAIPKMTKEVEHGYNHSTPVLMIDVLMSLT